MSVLPGGRGSGTDAPIVGVRLGRAACGPARGYGPLSGVAAPGRGSALPPVRCRRRGFERARLLSEVGDRVAEDLFEGHALGPQLVQPAPDGGAAEGAGPDVVGQA